MPQPQPQTDHDADAPTEPPATPATFGQVAQLFAKLGVIGFGGPAAHIAMMEDEVVARRKWLTRQHFLDLVGATNLIPGPNSTEMAIHVGYVVAGWRGLIAAGVCFVAPAAAMVLALAWMYGKWGQLPAVAPYLAGIQPAVLAVIAMALYRLSKKAVKDHRLAMVGLAVAVLVWTGTNPVVALLAGGLIGGAWRRMMQRAQSGAACVALPLLPTLAQAGGSLLPAPAAAAATGATWWKLALFFLKVGSVLYGSGYVLIAFLQDELVAQRGYLTQPQLLDAVALGQFTPGPVLTTATFIGYLVLHETGGNPWLGALAATVAIFLPSFVFVAILNPLIPKLRQWAWTASFLDGVNVASVGLMLAVLVTMGAESLTHWQPILIAALAAGALWFFKLNAAWIVLGGALLGAGLHWAGL